MKTLLFLLLTSLAAAPAFASPASELKQIVRCHEALDGKSDGHSEKLDLNQPTPIALLAGKKILFISNDTIYSLDKTSNADIIVRVEGKPNPIFRQIGFGKNGAIGTIAMDVSAQQQKLALQPHVALDDDNIKLFKKDLILRMENVTNQYQNKYDLAGTITALKLCQDVESPELQKNLNKVLAYYQKMAATQAGQKSRYNQDQ